MKNCYTIRDVIQEIIKMNGENMNGSNLQKFEEKIYFSGEFDSQQTEFEERSNQLVIGVVGSSPIISRACLRLVRYIIDDHGNELFETDLKNAYRHFESDQPGIRRVIDYLAYTEQQYCQSFLLGETFKTTLYKSNSSYTVETKLSEVDIWTIERLNQWYN